jgi:hypothetical protein
MKMKVSDLRGADYVDMSGKSPVSVEPSRYEIAEAVRTKDFDTRGFQDDFKELTDEWNMGATLDEYRNRQRRYHARRIAYFVANGIDRPIRVTSDQHVVVDGLHRLKAAKHSGLVMVEVEVCS